MSAAKAETEVLIVGLVVAGALGYWLYKNLSTNPFDGTAVGTSVAEGAASGTVSWVLPSASSVQEIAHLN